MMSVFLGVCFLPVLLILYWMERNEAKPKKGLILGVTLPPEGHALPQVQQIAAQFRRELAEACLLCAALGVPLFWVRSEWLSLTLWMVWLLAAMVLPFLPHVRANKRLKAIKKQHGWQGAAAKRVVDTAASADALPKPLGLGALALPLALSLLPMLPALFLSDPMERLALLLVYGIDSATLVLLWACGRWLFRRRADMVTADPALNQTLLRVRRLYWDRCWRLCLWACAGLNLVLWLLRAHPAAELAGVLIFSLLLVAAVLWTEFALRRAQERLTADGAEILADEDDAWLWGILYYNPDDRRTMVAQRVGMGTTVNLATRGGQLLMGFTAVVLAGCLCIGPVLGAANRQATVLTLDGMALSVRHGGEKYRIELEQVETLELREALPSASRVWGTGMERYLQGTFSVAGEGSCQLCLDPTAPPFLRVKAGGTVYWLGDSDPETTRQLAEQLRPLLLNGNP